MRQMKINLMRRLFFYMFMSVGYLCGLSQDLTDTLNISKMNTDSIQLRPLLLSPEVRFNIENHVPGHMVNLSDSVLNDQELYNATPLLPNVCLTSERSGLYIWNNGGIFISGRTVAYPGLMTVDNGALGLYQSFGNLNFSLGATANKYGWYQGLSTQYGLNGNLNYHFTPKLSATFYAIYYLSKPPFMANGMPLPPSMLGYYGYTRFGGYVDYKVNERIGVQFGGQIVKRTYSNRYEAEPIATPYITVGRKKKIGIGLPVGQILQGFFGK